MFRSIVFQGKDVLIVSERSILSHFALLLALLPIGATLLVGAQQSYPFEHLRISALSYLLFASLYGAMRTVDRKAMMQKSATANRTGRFSEISLALIAANLVLLAILGVAFVRSLLV